MWSTCRRASAGLSLFSGHLDVLQSASRHTQRERGEDAVRPVEYSAAARSSYARPGVANHRSVPDIQIRGGRIDFKFGDTKSVFYISDSDVDVYPNENGQVVIRFSGAPARTDQASQSFGELTARGLLQSGSNGENQLSMGVHLDRTAISELTRLFHGSDLGDPRICIRRRQAGRAAFQARHHRQPEHQRRASLGSDAGARRRLDAQLSRPAQPDGPSSGTGVPDQRPRSPIQSRWSSSWTTICPLRNGPAICTSAIFRPLRWSKPRGISARHFRPACRWKGKWKAASVTPANRVLEGS